MIEESSRGILKRNKQRRLQTNDNLLAINLAIYVRIPTALNPRPPSSLHALRTCQAPYDRRILPLSVVVLLNHSLDPNPNKNKDNILKSG